MADLGINGGTPRIDESRWRKMTPQEIIKEESKGEEIPAEILTWAQQMAAFAKIPDDVTYERVDGDVGIDALNRLGIEDEIAPDESEDAVETEEDDAVKDPDKTEETEEEDDDFSLPSSETAGEVEEKDEIEDQFSLADQELTADNDEIRKRKERKGIL